MSTLPFYRDQASRQQTEADSATLSNVRERCQRAADAWTMLADRLQRADDLRTAKVGDGAIKPAHDPIEDSEH